MKAKVILKKEINYIKEFGVLLEIIKILNKLGSMKIFNLKNKIINKKLKKEFKDIIIKYQKESIESLKEVKYIWIFWWQGVENAPDIVKKCIKKCIIFSNVVVIDKNNYKKYVDVEAVIFEKLQKGNISLTHFSDILRMKLLSKYGGYWVDATVYLSENVFSNIMDKEFFTPKLSLNNKAASKGKWCGFFIGGRNVVLFKFVNECFMQYWAKHNCIIDYFLIDYVINLAYENILSIKKLIDDNQFNNLNIYELNNIKNMKYDEQKLKGIFNSNSIHKLSYKDYLDLNSLDTMYSKL